MRQWRLPGQTQHEPKLHPLRMVQPQQIKRLQKDHKPRKMLQNLLRHRFRKNQNQVQVNDLQKERNEKPLRIKLVTFLRGKNQKQETDILML